MPALQDLPFTQCEIPAHHGRFGVPGLSQTLIASVARAEVSAITLFDEFDRVEDIEQWKAMPKGAIVLLHERGSHALSDGVGVRITARARAFTLVRLSDQDKTRWSKIDGRTSAFIDHIARLGCKRGWFIPFEVVPKYSARLVCHECRSETLIAGSPCGDPTTSSGACRMCGSMDYTILAADGSIMA